MVKRLASESGSSTQEGVCHAGARNQEICVKMTHIDRVINDPLLVNKSRINREEGAQ